MCAEENKKYWTAKKQKTAQQLPFLEKKIPESSWKSADVDHPLMFGPGRWGDGRRDGHFNGGVGAAVHFRTGDNLCAQVAKMWTGRCRGKFVCSPAALITALRPWNHKKSHSGDKSMCLRWLCDKYSSQQDYTMTPSVWPWRKTGGLRHLPKQRNLHWLGIKHNGRFASEICTHAGPVMRT